MKPVIKGAKIPEIWAIEFDMPLMIPAYFGATSNGLVKAPMIKRNYEKL